MGALASGLSRWSYTPVFSQVQILPRLLVSRFKVWYKQDEGAYARVVKGAASNTAICGFDSCYAHWCSTKEEKNEDSVLVDALS